MPDKKTPSFEEALKELEDIASQLSSGDLPLEKALELFEKGMKLKAVCSKRLDKAAEKIKILIEKDGTIEEKDFSLDDN
ncbi:MAG: exodeoxyribonuclease VII small subunit [Elusimicrobia bacterium]|nr:exodeoxyribonuclease VII small subunit [Elusimicrobiota bacterium]